MRKFITLFILLFCLTLIERKNFSRSITKKVSDTDEEVHKINTINYERLELSYQVGLTHKKAVLYRDNNKTIRKIDYIEYQDWYYLAVRQYYGKNGQIIFLICNSPARIYFSKAKPIGKLAQKQANTTVWYRSTKDYRKQTLSELRAGKKYEEDNGRRYLYIENYKKLYDNEFKGTYRFVKPGKSNQTILNNSTSLRSRANVYSTAIQKLKVFERVKILSVGKQESIDPWGKDHWYQVKAGQKMGWVFGAFLEPVEKKIRKGK